MDGYTALTLIILGSTVAISLTTVICVVHGHITDRRNAMDNIGLQRDQLTNKRSETQQTQAINEAFAKGEATALRYTSTEIRKALEAAKAPQVVVQR